MTVTPMTLAEIRKFEGTLYAENLTIHPISITDVEREVKFSIHPRGRDESIVVVPPRAFDVPGFRRMVANGKVKISNDPEMENRIDLMAMSQVNAAEAKRQELLTKTDDATITIGDGNLVNDLVMGECLISHERVFQTAQEYKDGEPPLAERFKDQAPQFIRTKVQDEDGNVKWQHTRIAVD